MRKFFLIFIFIYCSLDFCFAQSGWFPQNSGTGYQLNSICVINTNESYVAGSVGTVLKTTDGGNNWQTLQSTTQQALCCVSFINSQTGWVCGYNGIILKTMNGGNNWILQQSGLVTTLRSIYFTGSSCGWTVGVGGTIIRTTDGGNNWAQIPFSTISTLTGIYFINDTIGITVGFDLTLARSYNGGQNWNRIFFGGFNYNFYSINMGSADTGWIVGSFGIIKRTINKGVSWVTQSNTHTFTLNSVYSKNNLAWAVGDSDCILKTSNSGLNWSIYPTGRVEEKLGISFVDASTGWIVGINGMILKTTTGGEPIGIKPISSEIPKSYFLSQNYPNPFNPSTKIKFSVPLLNQGGVAPTEVGDGVVSVIIFDILGREVTTIVNEQLHPGIYEAEFDGTNYPSGVYFYKLVTDGFTETKRMVLLK